MQAELLSTYAVDLLPLERVSGSLRVRGSRGPDPQDVLVDLRGDGVRMIRHLTGLSMVLGVLAWIARRFS